MSTPVSPLHQKSSQGWQRPRTAKAKILWQASSGLRADWAQISVQTRSHLLRSKQKGQRHRNFLLDLAPHRRRRSMEMYHPRATKMRLLRICRLSWHRGQPMRRRQHRKILCLLVMKRRDGIDGSGLRFVSSAVCLAWFVRSMETLQSTNDSTQNNYRTDRCEMRQHVMKACSEPAVSE